MAAGNGSNDAATDGPVKAASSAGAAPIRRFASGMPSVAPANRRSSVTNGSKLFLALRDGNSAWSIRLRDIIAIHISDLGGAQNCSEAEKMLVRRSAMLALQLELLEQKWAIEGGLASTKELDSYQRTTGALRRVLRDLGLKRRSRDVTPSLDGYLQQTNGEAE